VVVAAAGSLRRAGQLPPLARAQEGQAAAEQGCALLLLLVALKGLAAWPLSCCAWLASRLALL
jgi:hypothetical protein